MIHIKVREQPPIRIETRAIVNVSDGGYERGYAKGHEEGMSEGYTKGHADGSEAGYVSGYEAAKEEVLSDPQTAVDIKAGTLVSGEITVNTTEIVNFAFCRSPITAVSAPKVTSIGQRALENCASLYRVDFPEVTSIGVYGFNGCTGLVVANIPLLKTINTALFYGDAALKRLDFHQLTSINASSMVLCSGLRQLIIRTNKVCSLVTSNALSSSGIANKKGLVFVPASLLESYKKATNWSAHAAQFRAVEDITVDGTIMGELDEDKIAAAMESLAA